MFVYLSYFEKYEFNLPSSRTRMFCYSLHPAIQFIMSNRKCSAEEAAISFKTLCRVFMAFEHEEQLRLMRNCIRYRYHATNVLRLAPYVEEVINSLRLSKQGVFPSETFFRFISKFSLRLRRNIKIMKVYLPRLCLINFADLSYSFVSYSERVST